MKTLRISFDRHSQMWLIFMLDDSATMNPLLAKEILGYRMWKTVYDAERKLNCLECQYASLEWIGEKLIIN